MFQGWRIKLREAEDAFRQGRLEEAGRLLSKGDLRQFLPAQRLIAKLAQRMAERARQRVLRGETSAGWRDLEAACRLGGNTEDLQAVRQELVLLALDEAEQRLSTADPTSAIAKLEALERRGVHDEPLRSLKEVAKRMESARNLCRRGRFAEAESQLADAAALRPDLTVIQQERCACRERLDRNRQLSEQLHGAMRNADWTKIVTLADQLLELAPENRLARDARKRAWAIVGAKVPDSHRFAETCAWSAQVQAAAATLSDANGETTAKSRPGARFLLWVDAVGGYLVCLNEEIILGQAAPGNDVDVAILADLSRRHARIRRQGEGYVIKPFHRVLVQGREIADAHLLRDGDEIQLGECVRLRFRQPHALSATARLDFTSRHRTQPWADAVLLMAESCVLGPQQHNHVCCRDWCGDVVIYRQDDQLYCRAMESIEIDGRLCDGRGRIGRDSHVAGDGFSLSLEEVV